LGAAAFGDSNLADEEETMTDDIDELLTRVKGDMLAGNKHQAIKRVGGTLKQAIKDGNTDLEQKLLWLGVAILERNSLDYDQACEDHLAVTKLSELYALIETLGRMRYPALMRIMKR
jgi:hypothetical protein